MKDLIKDLKILDTEVNNSSELSVGDFYGTEWMKPELLTQTTTHLFGNQFEGELLLHQMTIGEALTNGRETSRSAKKMNTMDYEWLIMGHVHRMDSISSTTYQPGDKVGQDYQTFELIFETDTFKKGYTIESENEVRVRIQTSAIPVSAGYKYTCQLDSNKSSYFLPEDDWAVGTKWAMMWSSHSEDKSEAPGSGHRVLPGKATNQINVLRASRNWRGNVANKQLTVSVPAGNNKTSNYLIDQDQWMFELDWMRSKETIMWYGEYNKDENGRIHLTEANSSGVIRQGAGVLQQIPNKFEYTRLTYDYLNSIIMDVFFANPETNGKTVKLITGQGGMEEFDRAMKDYLTSNVAGWNTTNDKMLSNAKDNSNNMEMAVGGYITKVYFIGGYSVEVIHNRLFDHGLRAIKSPRHPRTNLPLESYRMVFLDDVSMDGETNLQYVYEKGREVIDKNQPGMASYPSDIQVANNNITTTDKDVSAAHRIGTCGITMRRPNTSLHGIIKLS